jgi:hypothetical protein
MTNEPETAGALDDTPPIPVAEPMSPGSPHLLADEEGGAYLIG